MKELNDIIEKLNRYIEEIDGICDELMADDISFHDSYINKLSLEKEKIDAVRSVTTVLTSELEEDDDGVTSVLGVQSVDEYADDDDEGVTSVLGVQAVDADEDDDENLTSVLGVQCIDDNEGFEDGITFVHGKTL